LVVSCFGLPGKGYVPRGSTCNARSMTTCSISEVLDEGVECDRWVWYVSVAACVLVFGISCFIVSRYWDLLCHQRNKPLRAKDAQPDEGKTPPVLCIHSPNQHRECSGEFELLSDKLANGQPIWKKRGAERWLYSGFDGRWYICGPSTKERNWDCASGYIYNSSFHKGALPHRLNGSWEWSGGLQWHRDAAILVALPGRKQKASRRSQLSGILGSRKSSGGAGGKLNIMPRLDENGSPTVLGVAEEDLVKVPKSRACVTGVKLSKESTALSEDSRDSLPSTQDSSSHLDMSDTNTEGGFSTSSHATSRKGTPPSCSDTCSTATSSRRGFHKEPPQLLCVISPNGQRECAGTYEFVFGESANGQPLWKLQGGERWLYSGTSGRWCIGGADVKREDFARTAGFISQTVQHKGATPDRTCSVWQRWNGTQFEKDTRITVIQLHHNQHGFDDDCKSTGTSKLDLRGPMGKDCFKDKITMDDVLAVVV